MRTIGMAATVTGVALAASIVAATHAAVASSSRVQGGANDPTAALLVDL